MPYFRLVEQAANRPDCVTSDCRGQKDAVSDNVACHGQRQVSQRRDVLRIDLAQPSDCLVHVMFLFHHARLPAVTTEVAVTKRTRTSALPKELRAEPKPPSTKLLNHESRRRPGWRHPWSEVLPIHGHLQAPDPTDSADSMPANFVRVCRCGPTGLDFVGRSCRRRGLSCARAEQNPNLSWHASGDANNSFL